MSKTVSAIAIIASLALCFILGRCSKADPEAEVVVSIDSTFVVEADTNNIIRPYLEEITQLKEKAIFSEKVISELKRNQDGSVDTVYETRYVSLDLFQKKYSEEGVYDAWVTGTKYATLDSISVINKTITETITKTITQTIIERKWNVWFGVGGGMWGTEFYPKVVLDINSPKSLGFSFEAGYLRNAPMLEAEVRVKLFEF